MYAYKMEQRPPPTHTCVCSHSLMHVLVALCTHINTHTYTQAHTQAHTHTHTHTPEGPGLRVASTAGAVPDWERAWGCGCRGMPASRGA